MPTELPKSVDNALQNISDKPTKQIGDTLGDLFYLVFSWINQAAEKRKLRYAFELEKYESELRERTEKIPEEHRIFPDIQTVGPALEASKFCAEKEEIRHMFVNLISASMDDRYANDVHPSFPDILRQMTPLDAQNLSLFKTNGNRALVQYALNPSNEAGYVTIFERGFLDNPNETDLNKQAISISALERLGVVSISLTEHLTNEQLYEAFYKHPYYAEMQELVEKDPGFKKAEIIKGCVAITPLGESLIKVCLPDA